MGIIRSLARSAIGSGVRNRTAGRGLLGAGLGLIAARIATRSLPGAALVGGGLVAKYLWDRKREREAAETAEGETDIAARASPADEPSAAS
ncbi:MAG: hypothetical protein AAGE05_06410 [Pseudomonadota bacterium]